MEHLEANYKKLGLVGQIWVYGNSFESTLLAVVVPEESAILGWAKDAGVAGGYSDVCASKQTKDHLLQQLNATAKAAKLKVGTLAYMQLAISLSPMPGTVGIQAGGWRLSSMCARPAATCRAGSACHVLLSQSSESKLVWLV